METTAPSLAGKRNKSSIITDGYELYIICMYVHTLPCSVMYNLLEMVLKSYIKVKGVSSVLKA